MAAVHGGDGAAASSLCFRERENVIERKEIGEWAGEVGRGLGLFIGSIQRPGLKEKGKKKNKKICMAEI